MYITLYATGKIQLSLSLAAAIRKLTPFGPAATVYTIGGGIAAVSDTIHA